MKEMQYRSTRERQIFFDLPNTDGLRIKGILRGKLEGPVAIMMHGRPGTGNDLLQYLGSRYLYERGISVLRLFMYDFAPKTRDLMDCTLQTHVSDFEIVVKELRKQKVGQLFAIGHSYGGLTILKSKAKLDGAVLWDPSHGLWWADNRSVRCADKFSETVIDGYVVGTAGCGWVYPTRSLEQDKQLGDTSGLAAKDYPLKVIIAGKGPLADLGSRYYEAANEPKSRAVIAGAGHSFEESDEVMLQLFEETLIWLKDF